MCVCVCLLFKLWNVWQQISQYQSFYWAFIWKHFYLILISTQYNCRMTHRSITKCQMINMSGKISLHVVTHNNNKDRGKRWWVIFTNICQYLQVKNLHYCFVLIWPYRCDRKWSSILGCNNMGGYNFWIIIVGVGIIECLVVSFSIHSKY